MTPSTGPLGQGKICKTARSAGLIGRFAMVVLLLMVLKTCMGQQTDMGWPTYGGNAGGQRYSASKQITPVNVKQLQKVWEFHTGALGTKHAGSLSAAFEATPVLFHDTLYLTTPFDVVFALDPATGTKRWSFDPQVNSPSDGNIITSRGVATWAGSAHLAEGSPCRSRILFGTLDTRLIEIDAATGEKCVEFGTGGELDLTLGVDHKAGQVFPITSPPTVVGDVVVVGSSIPDNQAVDVERGTVRAFDVRTGKMLWSWEPIPWAQKQAVRTGAANVWNVISSDPELGMIYLPTGSASPDYYGGMRPGDNRDADSVVALDAETGRKVWAFQVVHHNLWDYDVAPEPLLFTFRDKTPAVAVTTKMGMVFVLDRRTGVPLWPLEERPVPQSDVPGEQSSPTQPFSTLSELGPLSLTQEGSWKKDLSDERFCNEQISKLRNEGIYTPPSLRGSVEFPGPLGGVNWGSAAFDPSTGTLYANNNRYPYRVQLFPRGKQPPLPFLFLHPSALWFNAHFSKHVGPVVVVTIVVALVLCAVPKQWSPGPWGGAAVLLVFGLVVAEFIVNDGIRRANEAMALQASFGVDQSPQSKTPYVLRREPILDHLGHPCAQQPWSALTALNLNTGKKLWEKPLGTLVEGQQTGTVSLGGPMVTAGGLVFSAGTREPLLRAFDAATGEELWKGQLPVPAQATPMSYQANGKQYVVVSAGGHGAFRTPQGDSVVAFRLP
jgi:quinoprotein glucose dehydrogenase